MSAVRGRRSRRRAMVLAIVLVCSLIAWILSWLGGLEDDRGAADGGRGSQPASGPGTSGEVPVGDGSVGDRPEGEFGSPGGPPDGPSDEAAVGERPGGSESEGVDRTPYALLDLGATLESSIDRAVTVTQLADLETEVVEFRSRAAGETDARLRERIVSLDAKLEDAWTAAITRAMDGLDSYDPASLTAVLGDLCALPETEGVGRLVDVLVARGLRLPELRETDEISIESTPVEWRRGTRVWSRDLGEARVANVAPDRRRVIVERRGDVGGRFETLDATSVLLVSPEPLQAIAHGLRCAGAGNAVGAAACLAQAVAGHADDTELVVLRSVFAQR